MVANTNPTPTPPEAKPGDPAVASIKDISPEKLHAAAKVLDSLLVFFCQDFQWASQIFYLMERIPVIDKRVKTMGVAVRNDRLLLMYNPFFVTDELDRMETGFVLVHESLHIMFHHVTKRRPHMGSAAKKWNIAADLAINCLIPRTATSMMPVFKKDLVDEEGQPVKHPNGQPIKKGDRMGVLPVDYKFEDKKSMEWYFDAIPENEGGGGGDGEGEGDWPGLDSHELWEPSDLVDQEVKQTVERIEKNRLWGNMPAEVQAAIKAAQVSEVPWWKILRHLIGDLMSKTKIKTSKKVNRRMPIFPWKGDIKSGVDRKLVAFDTSGSVGDDELMKFLSEVNRLVEDEQPVDAVCFDTCIKGKVRPFSRSAKSYKFEGRGGTAFTPVVEFAKQHHYKHLIIFTDGQAECPPHVQGLDLLWIITPEGSDTPPQGFQGRFLKMKKLKAKPFRQ